MNDNVYRDHYASLALPDAVVERQPSVDEAVQSGALSEHVVLPDAVQDVGARVEHTLTILGELDSRRHPEQIVLELSRLIAEVSQPGQLADDALELLIACQSTRDMVRDFATMPAERELKLDWFRRLDWIKSELDLLHLARAGEFPEPGLEQDVFAYRDYFKEDERGIPAGWRGRVDPFGVFEDLARERSLIRMYGALLRRCEETSNESDFRDVVENLVSHANDWYIERYGQLPDDAIFLDLARLLSRTTSILANPESSVDELAEKMSLLRRSWEVVSARHLPEVQAMRAAYPGMKLEILEHVPGQQELPLELLEQIESVEQKLLIRPGLKAAQEGFGRVLPVDELQDLLASGGARLFTLSLQGELVGFYMIHSECDKVHPDIRQALDLVDQAGLSRRSHIGWAEIVGISREGRRVCRQNGIHAYEILDRAVQETAASLGLDRLFGEVREGVQANLAKSSHLKRGWNETEIVVLRGTSESPVPYRVLRRELPLCDQNAALRELYSAPEIEF